MNQSVNNNMVEEKSEKEIQNVCDFKFLTEIMRNRKDLITKILNTFLSETPKDLISINQAVAETNYLSINNISHGMKSSIFVLGISTLVPILQEMEDLGIAAVNIEKINELNKKLHSICERAIEEVEQEKSNYI
jgi:HPt (histidine-containing phosphotransfer) domain-containing protein